MAKEEFEISDESGDRKYFTIIPNYIYNHSTIWDREVYCQMKRIAGERGTCWASRTTLAKQCGISARRIDKSLKYLIEHDWIRFKGTKEVYTKGGAQQVKEYAIVDLWKKNIEFYETQKGVAHGAIPEAKGVARNTQRGSTDEAKGVAHGAHKEEPVLKKNHIKEDTAEQSSASNLVSEVIKAFEEVDPKNKTYYGNKTQRVACDFLISEYGLAEVLKRIGVLPKTNKVPYFPTITTPVQLRDKWVQLQDAVDRKRGEIASVKKTIIV